MRLEAADEEEFMNIVADFIGKLTERYEAQRIRAEMAEHQLRVLENNC